jgi:hypothetical protein
MIDGLTERVKAVLAVAGYTANVATLMVIPVTLWNVLGINVRGTS